MINIQNFLKQNTNTGTYALVTYNGKTEAIWFARLNNGKDLWYLESDCSLYRICDVNKNIDDFCKKYMEDNIDLEEGENIEDYINLFVKPMIVENVFYEIINFQTPPFLPKEVDDIKLVSERECLLFILNK